MSALVISGNLLLLSAFIAGNVVEPNPFALMSGLFILPLCISMAAQQYRGTFRGVPSAATTASVLLYVFAGFLLFGVITSTGEAVLQGSSLHLMAPFLIPMLVAAALCVAFGRMNALWSRKLREGLASGVISPVQRGFSLRELLLAVGVVAAMTGITSQFIESAPPRYAESIDPSAAPFRLPSGATDVYAYSSELNGPGDITVANGLFYSWSKEDRGVYAAFDRTTGRAYYHAHFH